MDRAGQGFLLCLLGFAGSMYALCPLDKHIVVIGWLVSRSSYAVRSNPQTVVLQGLCFVCGVRPSPDQ